MLCSSTDAIVLLGRLVRSYLLHYGYEDTLNSFDLAGKSTVPPIFAQENGYGEEDIAYALNQRKTLRQVCLHCQLVHLCELYSYLLISGVNYMDHIFISKAFT